LLLGILAYGLYFLAAHSAAQIAANAARASVAGITDAERERLARDAVALDLKSHPLFQDHSKLVVTAGRVPTDPTSFRVAVTYDAERLPIWNLSSFLPLPSRYIEQSAVIKMGGY
jgi:Flp pilus assembly protein TadG